MKKPILLPPSLIRGANYRPPSPKAPRNNTFICTRTDEHECTLSICGENHPNIHITEYLIACDILMFCLETCGAWFSRLEISGHHMMFLTDKEASNVLRYLHYRQKMLAKQS
jgi:hypothetical protein